MNKWKKRKNCWTRFAIGMLRWNTAKTVGIDWMKNHVVSAVQSDQLRNPYTIIEFDSKVGLRDAMRWRMCMKKIYVFSIIPSLLCASPSSQFDSTLGLIHFTLHTIYTHITRFFESSPELIVLDRCYKQRPCLVWCVFFSLSFFCRLSPLSNTIATAREQLQLRLDVSD